MITYKNLLFLNSSSFNISRQKLTVLQPVQKEVVQSWSGPFIDFHFGSLALVLSRFMKEGKTQLQGKNQVQD